MAETYGEELAEIYDTVYEVGAHKDFAREVAAALALIRRQRAGDVESLLDVACGTGGHLRHFRSDIQHVEGLELSAHMLKVARAKMPGVAIHAGDMRGFQLHRRFDAVVCLFSSIGYAQSLDELKQAIATMANHLNPGGVLLIEPWFGPDEWLAGAINCGMAESGDIHIVRMGHASQEGRTSIASMHYLVGRKGQGITHFTDEHRMTLFTRAEYEAAFAAAGLTDVSWEPEGITGRGCVIGTAGF